MSAPPVSYKRVPGLGSGAFENSRLYLGPDHLLLVGSTAWSESYRRFYFRDIQAVIIRTSAWGKIQNAVWALLFFLVAIIAIQVSDVGAVIAWIIASGFALGFIVNTLRGPTCVCHIQTAVQTTKLIPLGRVRRAQKFLAQLKSIIAEVQGTVTATATADAAGDPPAALRAPDRHHLVRGISLPKLGGRLPPRTARLTVPPGTNCIVPATRPWAPRPAPP